MQDPEKRAQRRRIAKLYSQGMTLKEIAKAAGLSVNRVIYIIYRTNSGAVIRSRAKRLTMDDVRSAMIEGHLAGMR